MPVEIYINGEKADTDGSTKIAETRQINDFIGISDRQTSYTNSFKLPKSERNKMLFGGMGIPGNTSIMPYRLHNVSVFREGVQTIANGTGHLKSVDDSYNMHVYHENINLFDAMGGKSLADLGLAPLDHTLGIETWLASFGRDDYVYAIADYGKLDAPDIEIDYQAPALYVAFLWNRIFSENGFKWAYTGRGNRNDYNPFLSEGWGQLAITIDGGLPTNTDGVAPVKKLEVSKIKASRFVAETVTFFGMAIIVNALPRQIVEYIRFNTVFDPEGLHLFSKSTQYKRSRIRVRESGFYRINVTGAFSNTTTEHASLYMEKDGANIFNVREGFPPGQSNIGFSGKVYLSRGEELLFKVATVPTELECLYSYEVKVEAIIDNSVTAVNFSQHLAKIKQKSFFKDIVNFLGLVFRRNGNTYEFISLEELLDPIAGYSNYNAMENGTVYEDWSGKFHRVASESPKVGNYARRNTFTYKYDNPGDTFGDGIMQVDDGTLPAEKALVQRIYRAPAGSNISIASQEIRQCRFYEKEYDSNGALKNVKPIKGQPYFFRVKKVPSTITYTLAGFEGNATFTGQTPFMSFEDLDFNNVLANRYAAFSNTVNYGSKITVELFLSVLDMHSLDFFKLKYLKQLGQFYYLNKITNFTGAGLVKAELVRVRSIEELGQFSDGFSDSFNT